MEIELCVGNTDQASVQLREREMVEDIYFRAIALGEEYISNVERAREIQRQRTNGSSNMSTTGTETASSVNIKLPTISLPTFDGRYENWLHYKDTFLSLIHENENLSAIQRFHYLRASLKDEALRVIQAVSISAVNYEIAWRALQDRFENKRLLVHNHVKALFDIQSVTRESCQELRRLLDDSLNHIRTLELLGQPTSQWDTLLIYLLYIKFDASTKRAWEKHIISVEVPTFQILSNFLREHCQMLERTVGDKQGGSRLPVPAVSTRFTPRRQIDKVTSHLTTTRLRCPLCDNAHSIFNCNKFAAMSSTTRAEEVKRHHLCFNCLKPGHQNRDCNSGGCKRCGKRHNTLLHVEGSSIDETREITDMSRGTVSNHASCDMAYTFLPTAMVCVYDRSGGQHSCRVLLDSGSQSNFITQDLCKKLSLSTRKIDIPVSGISDCSTNIKERTSLNICSRYNNFRAKIDCFVLPKITEPLPSRPIDTSRMAIPHTITLADPGFDVPGDVQVLIGVDLFWTLLCIGQVRLGRDQPILQKTRLGWIVAGQMSPLNVAKLQIQRCYLNIEQELCEKLTKFWDLEEPGKSRQHFSESEMYCERHFQETVKRREDGRFEVSIPFADEYVNLGDSETQARRRFLAVEGRLHRDKELRRDYVEFMEEYQRMGHMTQVGSEELPTEPHYYLPHHPVFKRDSLTSKLRVVFDGSATDSSGLSLNNVQHVGPKIQRDLFDIVVRFRQYNYVITADIEKMYRQIWIPPAQSHFHRIFWRSDRAQPLQVFRLTTVTYGTASAPYLATRCLKQVADDIQVSMPKISQVIKNDFYVDDLLSGAASVEEAIYLRNELSSTLKAYGFNLRKWVSNDHRVLLDVSDVSELKIISESEERKTLGILWSPSSDALQFSVASVQCHKVTKRSVLSVIAQIFDPLGLIGPVTITARVILQELWQLHIDWEESLPMELHNKWMHYYKNLHEISKIRIPRHVVLNQLHGVQLHGFCDASEKAYGACVYIVSKDSQGALVSRLLCAKARVAPLRSVSVPRLELCGAVVLAQLMRRVTDIISIPVIDSYYWCDSMVTLSWIRGSCHRWKVFVANRVSIIQELTDVFRWRYVPTEENAADVLSRGIQPNLIGSYGLWWNGPPWLLDANLWPVQEMEMPEDIPEARQTIQAFVARKEEEEFHLINKFSSYNRVLRVTAWCLRFKTNSFKLSDDRIHGPLSPEELKSSEICLLKLAQTKDFRREIYCLKNNQNLDKGSKLCSLCPFVDSQGLLRVGGRLRNAGLSYDRQHQVILDSKSHFTKLIVRHEHYRLMHAGPQAVLASLRRKYWPLAARNMIKKIIRECVICFKANPRSAAYMMGDLPMERVTASRAFLHSGVDYAGPVYIKDGRLRNRQLVKAYICIFVCLCTKAIHLEAAVDMSSGAFLNCLRRFVARRGKCSSVWSDNGTNFTGAKSQLDELGVLLKNKVHQNTVIDYATQEGITWKFIPPHAPHFGGLWERGVRSVKHHLRRTLHESYITFEELSTILAQIESCLNSRPLSPLSDSPDDLLPLTPGHFLIGEPLMALPDVNLTHLKINRLDRYQRIQYLVQQFWNQWRRSYLSELQNRSKWQQQSGKRPNIGDMVLIRDDHVAPLKWPMGRIVEGYPGSDGIIRVVSVKTTTGIIKRPLTKLCFLPMQE